MPAVFSDFIEAEAEAGDDDSNSLGLISLPVIFIF